MAELAVNPNREDIKILKTPFGMGKNTIAQSYCEKFFGDNVKATNTVNESMLNFKPSHTTCESTDGFALFPKKDVSGWAYDTIKYKAE